MGINHSYTSQSVLTENKFCYFPVFTFIESIKIKYFTALVNKCPIYAYALDPGLVQYMIFLKTNLQTITYSE